MTTTIAQRTQSRQETQQLPEKSTGKPAAVLIGLDSMQGLPAARVLAGHGIPVIGIASNPKSTQCRTNVCREIIQAPTADVELIPHLVELGKRLEKKAVLFPCEDTNVLLVSRHRQQLEKYFHVLLPAPEVVEMLMDKVSFYSWANEHGLAIPKTFFIRNAQDLEQAASELSFPCVLKPHDSAARNWEDKTIFKAFKIHGADELIATHNHYQGYTDCFIAQEWIEGSDSDLYSCNCYFNADSEPLVTFVARKIRQWPPDTGVSCLGEEVRNDTVLEETIRLFRSVNYRGLGYLEMKQDKRNGSTTSSSPISGGPRGGGPSPKRGVSSCCTRLIVTPLACRFPKIDSKPIKA